MSLINDALKRAKEAQQQNQPAASGPPLRPSESAQPQAGSGSKTLLYIMVACVVFGNALLFFAVGWKKESPPAPASASATAPATNLAPVVTTSVAAAPATSAPAPQPVETVTNAAPVSASVTESNSPFALPVAVVEPEPPKPAPMKLQSIINSSRPSAMISGKFLFIGDKFRGYKVTAIDQESVTLIGNGETNVLSLP